MSDNENTTTEKLKLEMLETLIRGISEKLHKAEVLNGGFDRMQTDIASLRENVGEIRTEVLKVNVELSHVREQSVDFKKDLARIDEAIYHPDNGIYKRIHRTSDIEELREKKLDKALEKIDSVEKMVVPIEQTEKNLKKIAGDDLKELNTIVKTRQNIDRIFWILVTAMIGGGAKVLWDLISAAG
jgi:chromosome segregation ATPase